MKPRRLLGLALSVLATSPVSAGAAEGELPPLQGGATTSPAAPPQAPAAPSPAPAPTPAAAPPEAPAATAPTETPAATAPAAPSEPPPPVYEVESDFPATAEPSSESGGAYSDELETQAQETPAPEPLETMARRPWEVLTGLGLGNAICDDNDLPNSGCPVQGGVALSVGGGYRFVPNFSVGIEGALWSYAVRDGWRGGLTQEPDDVAFASAYLALYGRWYWFDRGKLDPYLHAGIGLGVLGGTAKVDVDTGDDTRTDEFTSRSTGWVVPFGIGVDWQLGRIFRLGPQALIYWQHTTKVCQSFNDVEACQDRDETGDGDELDALPWRIMVSGTFTLGSR